MGKKIKTAIAIGSILIVAVLLGGLIWFGSKKLKQNEDVPAIQSSVTQNLPNNTAGNSKNPIVQQPASNPDNDTFDCKGNEQQFAKYSANSFNGKDYLGWCEDCKKNNGKPEISHDAGPFCNLKTSDFGKNCTDLKQCEGHCIAKAKNEKSGTCTEYKTLESGCGWLEVSGGRVEELCVD